MTVPFRIIIILFFYPTLSYEPSLSVQAGGMLTGKHKFEEPPEGGRFSTKTLWGWLYRCPTGVSLPLLSLLERVRPAFLSVSSEFSQSAREVEVRYDRCCNIVLLEPGHLASQARSSPSCRWSSGRTLERTGVNSNRWEKEGFEKQIDGD